MPFKGLKFITCVLVALSIWLLYNLSIQYSDNFHSNVLLVSNIEGRSGKAVEPVVISARVRTTGYNLLRNRIWGLRKIHEVYVSPEKFEDIGSDRFSIHSLELSAYVNQIFGKNIVLESFVEPQTVARFSKQSFVKVPIIAVSSLDFRPQFMSQSGVRLSPDSVLVYGEQNALVHIDRVMTRQLTFHDLKSSKAGSVRLDVPKGARLSMDEVDYSIEVVRYVELRKTVRIAAKGCPVGKTLSVFPSNGEAVFKMEFPVRDDLSNEVEFFVEYSEFALSRGGECVVRHSALPSGVLDVRIEPDVFECVENAFR